MRPLPIAFILAAVTFAAPASAAPDPNGAQAQPLLVPNADGSWTITRAIHAEPVPLAAATGGLVADEYDYPFDEEDSDARAETEADARVERAFEEEIDKARAATEPD